MRLDAFTAILWLGTVFVLAAWFRHHLKHPAPGKGTHPPRPVAAELAPRPAPAPGHHVAFTVTTWKCGHMRAWDGHGHTIAVRECHCRRRADWTQWEQEFTR